MQHRAVEAGRLADALALLAGDAGEVLAELARLEATAAEGGPGGGCAGLVEAALAPLGFRGRRATVLGYPEDFLLLRRTGEAPPCTFLFYPGLFYPGPFHPGLFHPGLFHPDPVHSGDARGARGRPACPGLPGQLAACLAALRAAARARLALAFTPGLLLAPAAPWPGLRALAAAGEIGGEVARFDGLAVPRVWPGCFGTLEVLIRVRGRASHPGAPGQGLNAVEAGVPLLQALAALGRTVARRGVGLARDEPDAPLRARLTLAAVHGGQRGSSLATVFDVLVNRRYTPAERHDEVLAELVSTAEAALAASPAPGMELQVTSHTPPVPDPLAAHRPRAEAALGLALGWPHQVLRLDPAPDGPEEAGLAPVLLGGTERPGDGGGTGTPAGVLAQARAVLAYLAADFRPGKPAPNGGG